MPTKYRRQPDIRDYFQTRMESTGPDGDAKGKDALRPLDQPSYREHGGNAPCGFVEGGFHERLLQRSVYEEEDGDDGALVFEPDEDRQESPAEQGSTEKNPLREE